MSLTPIDPSLARAQNSTWVLRLTLAPALSPFVRAIFTFSRYQAMAIGGMAIAERRKHACVIRTNASPAIKPKPAIGIAG